MVNKNEYEVKYLSAVLIKITRGDEWKSFVLMQDQLVSVLWLDPLSGEALVDKGRVEKINIVNIRAFDDFKSLSTESSIILDISTPGRSKYREIKINNILDIHEIDWEYPDISKAVVDGPFVEWESSPHDASAPTHSYEITISTL